MSAVVVSEQRSLIEIIRHPKFQQQIQASLPSNVSLDRFTAVTVSAINHNPDILKADRNSFFNAIVKAAQDGLLPDGEDSFLNIYPTNVGTKDKPKWIQKVQYQKMVGGILKLFERAGIDAFADSIYENDAFDIWADESGQHFIHRPAKLSAGKGARIGAYAVAKRPGGRLLVIQAMDADDLAKVRSSSKNPNGPAWAKWPDRMEQKAALHRLKKRVATIDERAAAELNKIDNEFDDDDEAQSVVPDAPAMAQAEQAAPEQAERPKGLQSVIDQSRAEAGDGATQDPGFTDADII